MATRRMTEQLIEIWRRGLRPGSAAAYGFAICCAAVATGVRVALGAMSSGLVPFATFFPAVLLVTFIGGVSAGLLTLVLGALISWWLFLPPNLEFLPIAT